MLQRYYFLINLYDLLFLFILSSCPWNVRGKKTSIGDVGWVQRGAVVLRAVFVPRGSREHRTRGRKKNRRPRLAGSITSLLLPHNPTTPLERFFLSIDNTTHLIDTDSLLYKDKYMLSRSFSGLGSIFHRRCCPSVTPCGGGGSGDLPKHLTSKYISSDHANSRNRNNQDFRPRRIILLRHGQSLGNVDESAYVTTADWRIPLTDLGQKQAQGERFYFPSALGFCMFRRDYILCITCFIH